MAGDFSQGSAVFPSSDSGLKPHPRFSISLHPQVTSALTGKSHQSGKDSQREPGGDSGSERGKAGSLLLLRQWGAELLGRKTGSQEPQQVEKRALGRSALCPLNVTPWAACGAEGWRLTQELGSKTKHHTLYDSTENGRIQRKRTQNNGCQGE